MKRFAPLLVALLGFALLPTLAHAQVIIVQPARMYVAPVVVNPPVVTSSYYVAPSAPPVTVAPSYSYYSGPSVVTYSSPAPLVTYSSPAPLVTYSAPAAVYVPSRVETRSYYGFGILRPRGWYTETYYRP
jgi:hypothetical protein